MITIVGNALNSNNKKILDKMNKMDFDFVKREVLSQIADGAEFIELNAHSLKENEKPFLKEAIRIIEDCGGKVLVRSGNIDTLIEVVKIVKNEVVVGDIEFDKEKINHFIKNTSCENGKNVKIVALVKEKGNNDDFSPEKSLLIAQMFIDHLIDMGVKRSNILLDPVLRPLEDDLLNGKLFLNTLELFKLDFPQVKTIANLSVLSQGLPMRCLISSHFVSLAIEKGLDYIVLDVLEQSIIESIITTLTIIGKDRNMQSYLTFCRNSREARRRG
jgi:cobalamin-dependent methionine synthase I